LPPVNQPESIRRVRGFLDGTESLTNPDYPSLAYANVCPLTMLMRILVAQIAVLWLC